MPKDVSKRGMFAPHRFTELEFRPYLTAIGRVALAWNALHEELGRILCRIMTASPGSREEKMVLAIWQSSTIDRLKRAMLQAALLASTAGKKDKMADDIIWILNKAEALEDGRNNVIHGDYKVDKPMGTVYRVPVTRGKGLPWTKSLLLLRSRM